MFWDEGKQVGVSDSPFVDWAIVLYSAEVAVFLYNVEESTFVRAFIWADCPSCEVFLDEFSEFL
jgi:hypothetical protein